MLELQPMPRSLGSITKGFSITMAKAQNGGAAVFPPGGFQSAAHPKDVQGVLDHKPNRLSNSPRPISNGWSERPSSWCRPRVLIPSLLFSPQEPGDHRNPGPNFGNFRLVRLLGSIFSPSEMHVKIYIEKMIKNLPKIEDLGIPKPYQNRRKIH